MERSQLGTRCLNKKKAWLRTETLSIASLMPASADPDGQTVCVTGSSWQGSAIRHAACSWTAGCRETSHQCHKDTLPHKEVPI